ncbi:hypothetical protein P5673_023792, partial [Acropora cervicornis]
CVCALSSSIPHHGLADIHTQPGKSSDSAALIVIGAFVLCHLPSLIIALLTFTLRQGRVPTELHEYYQIPDLRLLSGLQNKSPSELTRIFNNSCKNIETKKQCWQFICLMDSHPKGMKHPPFDFLETNCPIGKRSTEQRHYGHLDSPRLLSNRVIER